MRRTLCAVALSCQLAIPGFVLADVSGRYYHCLTQWSAHAIGAMLMEHAVEAGRPIEAWSGEQRNGARAYQLGVDYFPYIAAQDGAIRAQTCMQFAVHGPALLSTW